MTKIRLKKGERSDTYLTYARQPWNAESLERTDRK